MHKVVLYDMAWAGLRQVLTTKSQMLDPHRQRQVRHTRPTLRLCVALGVQTGRQKPGGQQQQSQYRESQKCGDKKRNLRPSISEPAECTSTNSNNSNNPGTGNSKSVKSNKPSGGSRANYKKRRGFQRISTKAERETSNALAAAAETTKPTL